MVMMSPYADSLRRNPQLPRRAAQAATMTPQQFGGLGSLADLLKLRFGGSNVEAGARVPQEPTQQNNQYARFANGEIDYSRRLDQPIPAQPAQLGRAALPNPFEGNEQYQALMDFQKTLAPSAEQQARLQELQSAFEGTGAYKDYRINQLQNQLQQRNPMMGMGLGGMRPMGMQPYQGFGRPPMMQQPMRQPMPMPRGGYNQYNRVPMQQPNFMQNQYQQQQYMNPYQQMRPQPQQFGGYGMGQQMGGYGSYGQMPNPYQPQQMGYNPNNFAQNQFQGYGGMQAQSQGVY